MFKSKYLKFINHLPMILPMLVFGVIISSAITVLIPVEDIKVLLGSENGIFAILLCVLLGIILPNEPFLAFPIIAGLSRTGIGTVSIIGILTSWSLFSLAKYPVEIGIIGPELSIKRSTYSFITLVIVIVAAWIITSILGIN